MLKQPHGETSGKHRGKANTKLRQQKLQKLHLNVSQIQIEILIHSETGKLNLNVGYNLNNV